MRSVRLTRKRRAAPATPPPEPTVRVQLPELTDSVVSPQETEVALIHHEIRRLTTTPAICSKCGEVVALNGARSPIRQIEREATPTSPHTFVMIDALGWLVHICEVTTT